MFLHRTNKGRVVYERRPHLFRPADVTRLFRGLVDTTTTDDLVNLVVQLNLSGLRALWTREGIRGAFSLAYQVFRANADWVTSHLEPETEYYLGLVLTILKELSSTITDYLAFIRGKRAV